VRATATTGDSPILSLWGHATTDRDGRFRIFLGSRASAEATITDAIGTILNRITLVPGMVSFELPE